MRITNQHTIKGNTITNQHTIKENTHHQPTYHKREYATKTIKQQKRIPMPNNNITEQKRIQCHESFYPFFYTNCTWAPMNRQTWFRETFSFSQRYLQKTRSAKSLTTPARCPCSRGLLCHNDDYADIDRKFWRPLTDFKRSKDQILESNIIVKLKKLLYFV